jgi:hypothetical protein
MKSLFSMVIFIASFDSASSAHPAIHSLIDIVFCEFVALWAMSFSMDVPASYIILMLANGLKMLWIDARSISAKMINVKSFRNCTIFKLIGNTVSPFNSSITNIDFSIPFVFGANPNPARATFLNFVSKSFRNRFHTRPLLHSGGLVNAL